MEASTELDKLITAEQDRLSALARRQYILEAWSGELTKVTRGKPFRIWNDSVWLMLLDTRAMLAIELASWAKAMRSQGGFLNVVSARHLPDLPRTRPLTEEDEGDIDWCRIHDANHAVAYERLFPSKRAPNPKPSDVDGLKERVDLVMQSVRAERDKHRAHPFEKQQPTASVRLLALEELRTALDAAYGVLSDLLLVHSCRSRPLTEMNWMSGSATARDGVDLVLFGGFARSTALRGDLSRKAYYDFLHRRHDALSSSDARLFNDFWEEA